MGGFGGSGVVVTGALGIYGSWIADAFAREGARLCLTDRDEAALAHRLAASGAAPGSFVHAAGRPADAYVTGTSIAVDGGNAIGSLVVHQDKKRAL